MGDENKSKFGPLNQLRARLDVKSVRESEALERKFRLEGELDWKLSGGESPALSAEELRQDVANIIEEHQGAVNNLESIKATRAVGPLKLFQQAALTATSGAAIHRGVNSMMKSPGTFQAGLSMRGLADYQLQAMHESAVNGVIGAGAALHEATTGVTVDPNSGAISGGGAVEKANTNYQQALQEVANITRAQQLRRKTGMDVESRTLNAQETYGRLNAANSDANIRESVFRGTAGTRGEVETTFKSKTEELGKALTYQASMVERSGEKFELLTTMIDELAASAHNAKKTLDEMDRQGASGGGGGGSLASRLNKSRGFQIGMRSGIAALEFTSELADTWGYSNPVREKQNQIRYANMGNQQYSDVLAGLGGDMGAMRRLGSVYGEMGDVNDKAKTASRISTTATGGAGIGKSILQGIAGAALLTAGSALDLTGIGAIAGVGMQIAGGAMVVNAVHGGLSSVNQGAADWNQQAGERGSALAGLTKEEKDALYAINDQAATAYVGHARAMGISTVGMGASRGNLFDRMTSSGALNDQAQAGLMPDQVEQLTAMGVQTMGSQFTANTVVRAGQTAQRGLMSAESYVQSAGRLSNVSSNAEGNLQQIMSEAVAAGMDKSKNIGQILDAQMALASKTISLGQDTSAATANAIGRSLDAMRDTGVNKDMRGPAAQAAGLSVSTAMSSGDLNIPDIMETAQFRKNNPNASYGDTLAFAHLNLGQSETLSRGGAAAIKLAKQLGIDDLYVHTNSKGVETFNMKAWERDAEIKRDKALNHLVPPGMSNADDMKKLQHGEVTRIARQIAGTHDTNAEAYVADTQLGKGAATKPLPSTKPGGGVGDINKQFVDLATGLQQQLEYGKVVTKGLEAVTKSMNDLAKDFNPAAMAKANAANVDSFKVGAIGPLTVAIKDLSANIATLGKTKK